MPGFFCGVRMALGRTEKEFLIKVRADIQDAVRKMESMEKSMQSQSSSAQTLSKAYNTLQTAIGALALTQLARQVIDTTLAFDQMGNKLAFATGSTQQAAREMAFLRSETKRLGVDLLQSGDAYASIAAAARGTALEGDAVREVFLSIAEASRVLNLSSEQTSGALRALEQIISKGSVQAEELRGQLGERLPGAFQIAARAMGVTTQALGDMLQAGEVLSEDFIPRFAQQLRSEIAGRLPEAVQSAAASFARLTNAINELQLQAGRSGFVDALAISAETLAENMDLVADASKAALVALAAFAANQVSNALESVTVKTIANAKAMIEARAAAIAKAQADLKAADSAVKHAAAQRASAAAALAEAEAHLADVRALSIYGPRRAAAERQVASAKAANLAATTALTRAEQGLATAQTAAVASMSRMGVIARGLGSAIGFLGGPIGALTTVLTAGATAWVLWGDSAETAYEKAKRKSKELADQIADIRERLANEENFGTGELGAVRQYIEQVQDQIDVLAQSRSDQAREKLAALRKELEQLQDLEQQLAARQRGPAIAGAPALSTGDKPKKPRRDPNEDAVKALEFEAATYGKTAKEIALYRLQLQGATADQLRRAEVAIDAVEAEEAFAEALKQIEEQEKTAAEESARHNEELERQAQYWRDLVNPANEFQRQLEEIEELERRGKLTAEQYQEATLLIMDAFDRVGEKAEETKDDLGQFAIEAARNIQDALGDGLYDILSGNFDDIEQSFVNTINRMVANAAAAQLAKVLFGDFDKTGQLGGVAGGFFSSVVGGLFHSGGIVGQAGAHRSIPLPVAARLPRYHDGGFAGIAPDERLSILQVGEEVLTRSDPRHAMNGGGTTVKVEMVLPHIQNVQMFKQDQAYLEREAARGIRRQMREP